MQLLEESVTFADKYVPIVNTSGGLLFFTKNKAQLSILLDSLLHRA